MANTLTNLPPDFWAKEAQKSLFVQNSALPLVANVTLENLLAGGGNKVERVILSYPRSQSYTPGTDVTATALTDSKEALTVDDWDTQRVDIDDTEKKQSIIDIGEAIMKRMLANHKNTLEQVVLNQTSSASHSLDAGNVGGSSGSNISVNTDNAPQLFTAADTKLDGADVPALGRVAVVGGHVLGQLKLQQAGRATSFGDRVNANGFVGMLFGWEIVYNNNLPYSATLNIATTPTTGDTVTVAGVTLTFKATAVAAGELRIGNAQDANAYVAAALNNDTTAYTSGTHFVSVSSDNLFILRDKRRITATHTTTTCSITGYGDIVVAETFTDVTDGWASQLQKSLFCHRGAIHLITQIPPSVEVKRHPYQHADIVMSLLGNGVKFYADGKREAVYVKVAANSADWS